MSDEPYRTARGGGAPDDRALARLAVDGQRRIEAEAAARDRKFAAQARDQEEAAESNLRMALGAHYGGTARWLAYALAAGGTCVTAGAIVGSSVASWTQASAVTAAVAGFVCFVIGVVTWALARPRATAARVRAERARVASLPFPLAGYFELLAADPVEKCRLLVEVSWPPEGRPGWDVLQGALGVWDPGASMEPATAATCRIQSSVIASGFLVDNGTLRGYVRPTGKVVASVYGLVESVLTTIHASHPIERVSMAREKV